MEKAQYDYSIKSYGVVRYTKKSRRKTYIDLSEVDNNYYTGKIDLENREKVSNLNKGFKRGTELSRRSKSQIIQRIQWLSQIANWKTYKTKSGKIMKYKLNMITLTFTGEIEEKSSKKLLNDFLNNCRNNYDLKNYVWKIELTKRGRIHYHIASDCDLTLDLTTKIWGNILRKAGFVGQYEVNSTDVKRFSNPFAYLAKYVGKNDENNDYKLTGRIWGSSESLNLKKIESELKDLGEYVWHITQKLDVNVRELKDDYFTIRFFDWKVLMPIREFRNEFRKRLLRRIEPFPQTCTWYSERIEELFKRQLTLLAG